jgi:phosphoglycerate dehydrogenase-like enzyme
MHVLIHLKSSDTPSLTIGPPAFAALIRDYPHFTFSFANSTRERRELMGQAELLFCWNLDAAEYATAPRLKAVFTPAAGHNWVQPDPTGRIPVFHGSFHGRLMAQWLIGAMLYFVNRFDRARVAQSARRWDRAIQSPRRGLEQQHVLIIGYGAIGRHCAALLKPFGCTISGIQRTHAHGVDPHTGVVYRRMEQLHGELAKADQVVLILPGDSSTDNILAKEQLSRFKPGAFFYNMGRGSVVDEQELGRLLGAGTLGGAALDVFATEPLPSHSPLWTLENVLITPHSSACFDEYGDLYIAEVRGVMDSFLNTLSTTA